MSRVNPRAMPMGSVHRLHTVACGLGAAAAGAVLFPPLAWTVGTVLGLPRSSVVHGALLAGCALVGIVAGQWLVLRRGSSWTRSLLLAEILGGMAGIVIAGASFAVLREVRGPDLAMGLPLTGGLIVFGVVQWLVLRARLVRAWRWALASVVGLAAGLVGASVFTYFFGHLVGGVLATQFGQFGAALFRAMQDFLVGSLYGAVTGRVKM